MVSKLAERLMYDEDYVKLFSAAESIRNPFDPIENPEGIVNIGTAVSGLMDDVLVEKFSNSNNCFKIDKSLFRYYQFWGPDVLRTKISNLMTQYFKPKEPISSDNIMVLNGALLLVDVVSGMLLNEQEFIMLPVPAYQGYFQALTQRWNLNISEIPMIYNEETGVYFDLTIQDIEKQYEEDLKNGRNVKAFLLNNPHNPLGRVFPKHLVIDIINFCNKNNLNLIVDEMYCMSIFDRKSNFHSVLELASETSMPKDKIHVIWGFSKDLCLTSFRVGVVHTHCKKLKMALRAVSQFQAPSLPAMNILENFITDLDWIKNIFVPTNHQRLLQAYSNAKKLFSSLQIETTDTSAGFFFLANLRPYMKNPDKITTEALFYKFKKFKVYVVPYWELRITEPGWFRIVFTVPIPVFCEGFARFKNALSEWTTEEMSGLIPNNHFEFNVKNHENNIVNSTQWICIFFIFILVLKS